MGNQHWLNGESAEQLRLEAAEDLRQAEERADDNPMYAEHLYRRAQWKDYLARQQDQWDALERGCL